MVIGKWRSVNFARVVVWWFGGEIADLVLAW